MAKIFTTTKAEVADILEDIDSARREGRDDGFRPCVIPMVEDGDTLTPEEEHEIDGLIAQVRAGLRAAVKKAGL